MTYVKVSGGHFELEDTIKWYMLAYNNNTLLLAALRYKKIRSTAIER
jgi:hypothetical protein